METKNQDETLIGGQVNPLVSASSVFEASANFTTAATLGAHSVTAATHGSHSVAFGNNPSSHNFSTDKVVGASNTASSFSTAGLFNAKNTSSSLFTGNTSIINNTAKQAESGLFGIHSGSSILSAAGSANVFSSSSGFSVQSPGPFGSTLSQSPGPAATGSVFGTTSNLFSIPLKVHEPSALFGKQTKGSPNLFLSQETPSNSPAQFTFKQSNISSLPSAPFGNTSFSSAFQQPKGVELGAATRKLEQSGETLLFGKNLADLPQSVGKEHSARPRFLFTSPTQIEGGTQKTAESVGVFDHSQSVKRDTLGMFSLASKPEATSQSSVFPRPKEPLKPLFGKYSHPTSRETSGKLEDQKSEGPDMQVQGIRKSLTKWSRAKETTPIERKKRGITSLTEEEKESKKARSSEGARRVLTSPAPVRSSSTRGSVEDLTSKTSIIVKDIPAHLNRGPILRRHFSAFGTVTRVQPMVIKKAANITFQTHEEALSAKNNGRYLHPDQPLSIFWRAVPKARSPDEKQTKSAERGRGSIRSQVKPKRGTVEDELSSMAEIADFQEEISTSSRWSDKLGTVATRQRSPTPPPVQQLSELEVARGLIKTINKAHAKDSAEKVAVLDARDKLLRLLRGKQQTNLATAQAFMGTCLDMCPEKERYYREDIRRLALYEVIPSSLTSLTGLKSKVDHCRAVKEYSRSSADQEEPLPHELRPLSVLTMTMNYLLSDITPLGEDGKWTEWYDFLWNRTRGIRKDITQQQLCDVPVAELLEKCARFHIFCSERLCEEDMMSFDAKINDENLTKCLQTLKELYADLEKRGIFCPNEAEFRSYMVLMNLNEGEILREIQQMRPEIRDSPDISFAVQVYHALNANNYVRFFRLIEEKATFLSACLLHRYFNQIRSKALIIIMKAHGALGKNIVLYPVEELIRLLCFENAREVELFCYHYGLSIRGIDVVLESKAYTEPEGTLPQTRSQSLIEIKQENLSIGEVLNGSALPVLQLPVPSSSFNQDDIFIMSSDLLEAIESSKMFRTKPSVEPVQPQKEKQVVKEETQSSNQKQVITEQTQLVHQKQVFSNEVVKSVAKMVILEVIDSCVLEIATDLVKEMDYSALVASMLEDVVGSSVKENLREIAHEVVQEQELKLRQKLEADLAAQRQQMLNLVSQEILDKSIAAEITDLAQEEMRLVQAELHHRQVARCSQQWVDDLLSHVTNDLMEDVATEVFNVDVVMKRERLAETEKLVQRLRCRRFFQVWKWSYQAQIRVKRAMLDFPSAPSGVSLKQQIRQLVPARANSRISDKSFFLNENAKLCIESPMEVIQKQLHLNVHLSMASARHMLANLVVWHPLDMSQTVLSQLQRTFSSWRTGGLVDAEISSLQWKIVLSIPDAQPNSSTEESTFLKWMRAKLCQGQARDSILASVPSYEGEILSLYQLQKSIQNQLLARTMLCVRCFHGAWSDNEEISVKKKNLLKGTSAVVFVTPCVENMAETKSSAKLVSWKRQKQRLHQILQQKAANPAVPLVLVIPRLLSSTYVPLQTLDLELELSGLHQRELISGVHVFQPLVGGQDKLLQHAPEWTTQLITCLRFAANLLPSPPRLRVKVVSEFCEDVILELYKATVYPDLAARRKHQLLHQSPNNLLSLYNAVIEHAASTIASDSLTQISWPAPEFDKFQLKELPHHSWNSEDTMCDLFELLSKMRLPYFKYSDLEADDWKTVCHDVWSFVAAVTKQDSGFAKISLHNQVSQQLIQARKLFNQYCWLASSEGSCEPTYVNMVWTDLMDACIHYKLISLRTGQLAVTTQEEEDELTSGGHEPEEVLVYYNQSELNDWEPPKVWLTAILDTETEEHGLLRSTVDKAVDEKQKQTFVESMREQTSVEDMETDGNQVLAESLTQHTISITAEPEDTPTSSLTHLKLTLEQEKAASQEFDKLLTDWLGSADTNQRDPVHRRLTLTTCMSPIRHSPRVPLEQTPCASPQQTVSRLKLNNLRAATPTSQLPAGHSSVHGRQSPYLGYSSVHVRHSPSLGDSYAETAEMTKLKDSFDLPPTLTDRMCSLHQSVLSERQANVLFEMRLKRLLDSTYKGSSL